MKWSKSILAPAVILLGTAIAGPAFAHHRDWHHGGPPQSRSYVAPRTSADVQFGFSLYEPAVGYYYYEPAPRYYYEPAPRYYYEPAPSYNYYYYNNFPAPTD
jgi:hypothetical protein